MAEVDRVVLLSRLTICPSTDFVWILGILESERSKRPSCEQFGVNYAFQVRQEAGLRRLEFTFSGAGLDFREFEFRTLSEGCIDAVLQRHRILSRRPSGCDQCDSGSKGEC